jgi:hypothetical protein
MHGGIAIVVYLVFYLVIFGLDEVKWMLINAVLDVTRSRENPTRRRVVEALYVIVSLAFYGALWLARGPGETQDQIPL